MKKRMILVILLLAMISLNVVNGVCKEKISLNKESIKVIEGKTYELSVKNTVEKSNIKWSSNDTKIAKVNKNGLVTGVSKGKTTISCTVSVEGKQTKLFAKVTVLSEPNTVKGIEIKTSTQTSSDYRQRLVIKAYKNKKLLWTYKTKYAMMTELESFSSVYKKNNMLYFRDTTTVVTLNEKTGQVVWKTDGCGAGDLAFDNAGNTYVAGYYGPDIFCVDINGNIKYIKQTYDENLVRAYKLKISKNQIYIYYEDLYSEKLEIPYKSEKDKYGNVRIYIKVNKNTGKVVQ